MCHTPPLHLGVTVEILDKDDVSVLNVCAKYLARADESPRHNFGQFAASDPRARICEAWRFPVIDSYSDGRNQAASYAFNEVTFVHGLPWVPSPNAVGVVGTFASLHEPIPLRRIPATPFFTCTLKIPKGEVHTYKFIVDGVPMPDAINPQRVTLENGREWSRFFTHLCSQPVSFERWELSILDRLTTHILPFRTERRRELPAALLLRCGQAGEGNAVRARLPPGPAGGRRQLHRQAGGA